MPCVWNFNIISMSFSRMMNRRWSNLAYIFTIYLSVFVLIVSYQAISKILTCFDNVDSANQYSSLNGMHLRQQVYSNEENLKNKIPLQMSSFKFSRRDLRLKFRELADVPHDIHYDNTDTFKCVQSVQDRRDPNITEDLWCQSRPDYLPEYKNPCYITSEDGWYEDTTCLPYFHILGADKCGTTDFHDKLIKHPQVLKHVGNLGKESYYWCWLRYGLWMLTSIGRWKWYQYIRYFFRNTTQQIVTEYVVSGEQLISGDATPMDFWDFRGWPRDPHNFGLEEPDVLTPHLMRHVYKDPRFFVLMRNPVDRLYSDYLFLGVNVVLTPEDFARDVPISIAVMRNCLSVNSTRQCFFSDDVYHRMPVRLHIGCYSIFLREWLSVFHRRNFFFLLTEDWHKNTAWALQRAFEFLDVDPVTGPQLKRMISTKTINESGKKKKVGDMFTETRALLTEFYAPFNEDLAKLLGNDRYLWKGP